MGTAMRTGAKDRKGDVCSWSVCLNRDGDEDEDGEVGCYSNY
jgi:hypothetical protein